YVADRDSAAGQASDSDGGRAVSGGFGAAGDRKRNGARRTGVFHSQPGGIDLFAGDSGEQAGAESARGGGAWADGGKRARERDAGAGRLEAQGGRGGTAVAH